MSDITLKTYTPPKRTTDYSVWIGLVFFIAVLGVALSLSGSVAAFADFRAFLIVICGTIAIMGLSFSGKSLQRSLGALKEHLLQKPETPRNRAMNLMSLSVIARKEGILKFDGLVKNVLKKETFLASGLQMVSDDIPAKTIERILNQEIDAELERLQGAIALLRRGAEAAPAMGLIGTLIGLVQMLSKLDDPSTIGPAMAVALLTTFYGALLGSAFFAPLSGKLELQARNLILRYELIILGVLSMSSKENPRKLQQSLNSKLPATERINYFKD